MDNNIEAKNLLSKIAKSMNAKIVTWNDVNDAVARDISFSIIVDTNKYISKSEYNKLEQKSFIGTKI